MKIRRLTTQIGTIVVYLGCYVGAIGLGVGQDKDKGVRVTHAEVFASIFAKISDELAESDVAVSCRIKRAYDTDIWVVATSDQHNRHFITSAETDSCIRCRLSRAAEDDATGYNQVARRLARPAPLRTRSLSPAEMRGLISGAVEVVRQKASDIKAESERRMHEDTIDISLGTYYYELEIRSGDSIARASFSGSDFGEVVAESDLAQRFVWSMLHLSGRRKVKSER